MRTRRLLGGLGILLIVAAFFALPLYAAATICAMACCHQTPNVSLTTAGANDCSSECSVRSDISFDAAQATSIAAPSRTVHHATTAATAVNISAFQPELPVAFDVGTSRPGSRPLHILDTVFRI